MFFGERIIEKRWGERMNTCIAMLLEDALLFISLKLV